MGFLQPLFLLAGAAVLIPVFLHLFHRQESKILTFPAIRYLLRTERDHARQIRTQQLLLLLLRVAIVALIVVLGARIHFPGPGGSHEPTALALVIDNSMSATIIEDGGRRLDTLKAAARRSVRGAGHDDVIWVVRAGAPWEPALPGGIEEALAAIEATGNAHGRGELGGAVERARALVAQSSLPEREVHLFTDLQATGFDDALPNEDDIPVVVFGLPAREPQNRGIGEVTIGGGLPPLAGRRTEAAVSIVGGDPGDSVGVRLYIDGQVRAAGMAPGGATVLLPVGPFPSGRVEGYAEIDPDPLTADDRRYFAFTVREPTAVALAGPARFFLSEALAVLEESDRIVRGGLAQAATLLSIGGEGLDARGFTQSALVVPLIDPAQTPALNRRLAQAGIPYRYGAGTEGGARIASSAVAIDLSDIEVRRSFLLERTGDADNQTDGSSEVLVTLSNGDPWIVAGTAPTGPYTLFASPIDEESTSLPVSAAMIPLLEWAIERGWRRDEERTATAGASFRPPATSTAVRDPGGEVHPVDGDQPFFATAVAGFYQPLEGDSALEAIPVNTPASESDLAPLGASEVRRILPGTRAVVDDAGAWSRQIFRSGRGPEPWRTLALILLALLAIEVVVAAARDLRSSPTPAA